MFHLPPAACPYCLTYNPVSQPALLLRGLWGGGGGKKHFSPSLGKPRGPLKRLQTEKNGDTIKVPGRDADPVSSSALIFVLSSGTKGRNGVTCCVRQRSQCCVSCGLDAYA